MNLILPLVVGFNLGLSGAMIPGPLFLFTVSEVLEKDLWVGFKIVLGHLLIEAVFMALVLLGALKTLPSQKIVSGISIIGGVALVIMGSLILRKAGSMRLSRRAKIQFGYGAITGGAFFSAVSPGFLIWWATVGTPFLFQALRVSTLGAISWIIGHWVADVAWYGFVSYSVHKGKQYLTDPIYQNIMRILALMLIFMGIYFPTRP